MPQGGGRLAGGDGSDLLVSHEYFGSGARGAALRGGKTRDRYLRAFGGALADDLGADEIGLLLGKGTRHARLYRGDIARELVAVERHAGLEAQGIAGGKAARLKVVFRAGLEQFFPQLRGIGVIHDELEAILTGVAGARDNGESARYLAHGGSVVAEVIYLVLLIVFY